MPEAGTLSIVWRGRSYQVATRPTIRTTRESILWWFEVCIHHG